MKRSELAVRAGIGLLGVGALAAIVKLREPAVARAPSVSAAPASASAAPKARERRSGDLAVELRLVDLLDEAVYDAPKLSKATAHLEYWRRMRSPYVGPGGPLGRVVQEVSIVGEGGAHQFSMGLGHGKVWKPDLHIWNMAEGSFYQREAILAPPPARIRYHVTLPPGAVFEAAPAAIGQAAAVRFEVAVKRPGHPREVVARREVKGSGTRRWKDFTVDLSRFGGQTVDLELGTALLKPGRATPVALWGTPVVLAPGASDVPMNVLFFVVDALRGDAIARTHDDATDQRMAHAKHPPFEAWLPRMPEVAPNLDKLADSGVIFTQAFSGATWTRPGTIAMLTGSRSGDLGLGPLSLVPPKAELSRFYRRHPPFLPLLLRPYGVTTRAIVNNFYMAGYAGAGVDMGFEGRGRPPLRERGHEAHRRRHHRLARQEHPASLRPVRQLRLAALAVHAAEGRASRHPAATARTGRPHRPQVPGRDPQGRRRHRPRRRRARQARPAPAHLHRGHGRPRRDAVARSRRRAAASSKAGRRSPAASTICRPSGRRPRAFRSS